MQDRTIEERERARTGDALIRVEPVPAFVDVSRWLGAHPWQLDRLDARFFRAEARMPQVEAARLAARLRGLGLDGRPIVVHIAPAPGRALVRAARLFEARARRITTPGFSLKAARASGAGRYSLTPEALALGMAAVARGRSVVDACCGSGGNAVAFARHGCAVTAIDCDPERLAEAAHNARVYGVSERIRFVCGDALSELPHLKADVLFIDPPWSADYDKRCTRRGDLPLLDRLLSTLDRAVFPEVWLKLPASFDTRSVPPAEVRVWFGEAEGDAQRIKFLELKLTSPSDTVAAL